MKKLFQGTLLFSLTIAPGFAAALFQGNFATDNQVALFNITANSFETLTVATYSYAGGTVNSTAISSGGFAPAAFLFDNTGNVLTLTNGTCGQVGQDAVTGNCDDLIFQDGLGPGTFTLALVVYNNTPVDTALVDGFVQDGNPGFTCQEAGTSGNFCDLTTALGASRTGNYAISITGADSVAQLGVPEPGSMLLLFAGGVLMTLRRRSFNSQ
jgi:hypothetical protein